MQVNSFFQQPDSHQSNEMNNISLTAIPNQSKSTQNPKLIEFPKKSKKIKKDKIPNKKKSIPRLITRINLSKKWELQYFFIALQYSLHYPQYNLSWNFWKNGSYYNQISNLSRLMLPHCYKTSNQCKSKDQVLKKKYFLRQNPVDLLEISEKELRKEVLRLSQLQKYLVIDERSFNEQRRYENILKRIDESRELLKCKKKYEVQYEKLREFGQTTSQTIEKLLKLYIQ